MKRIVSVWLPDWPIERMARTRPGSVPDEHPFVLAENERSALIITALNGSARRRGVRTGMRLGDARAAFPGLASAPAEPRADRDALRKLAVWCGRYGPWRNVDGDDGLWIDATGVGHLFGGEAGLLRDLVARFRALGLTARPGLGDTPGAAWALARHGPAQRAADRIAPAGETAAAVAGLPVAGLRLEPETLTLLHRLGLKRIGQLYDLPRVGLAQRFSSRQAGEAVLMRLDQLLGRLPEPLRPITPAPCFVARRSFTDPLISAQGLDAVLRQLSGEVCEALERAHQGALKSVLTIYRSDGGVGEVTIGMSAPSRSPDHFLDLFGEKLDRLDAGLGIDVVTLAALATERLVPGQSGLAGGDAAGVRERRKVLVDRLGNRLGAACVFRPGLAGSHLPERAARRLVASGGRCAGEAGGNGEGAAAMPGRGTRPSRPMLMLAIPEPIQVIAEIPEGPPVRFVWRRVRRCIVKAQGPERIAPEWWRAPAAGQGSGKQPRTRDYYRIEDETGTRYWVFRDGLYGAGGRDAEGEEAELQPVWYLHGVFA